ncbi:MAG: universal stress protein [Stellaceae bacterium]
MDSKHRSPVRRAAVLSLPPSPAEAVVVVAEVMVPGGDRRPPMVRFRASAGKSNKTVSTSGFFTGDRWFESISLHRRVSCEPEFRVRLPSTIRSYWLPRPAASARRCDLIVIASHGRRGVSAVVLGSETVKVLTHSKIPVLVYR